MSDPATTTRPEDAVEARLCALESKDRLDLDEVTRAVRSLRRPEALRKRIGGPLRYSQRVEADVAALAVDTLVPHEPEDHLGRFLRVWVPDELGHAESQQLILDTLDLPAEEARDPDHTPVHNHLVGALARLSTHAHDMVAMTYHSIGSMNERLAMGAYQQMGTIADELGETELTATLFRPTYRDEAHHLGYYRTYASQLATELAPWKLAAARALVVHTYHPVGARDRADRAPFGQVLIDLEDDPENPGIADTIHDIAQDLLTEESHSLPPFTRNIFRSCVHLARQARHDDNITPIRARSSRDPEPFGAEHAA